ncbi:MAG: acyl-CoA thioesterase II [Myxococcales bacterium]|nr:acyl-CoA thioesterase II [Myxococcales bacterium]
MSVLTELVEQLRLERIEVNLFRGQSRNPGWGRVFGGQVVGQALSAAAQTVPEERPVHSLHAYFLRPGDTELPIVYEVDRIRDGKSFTTRRVVAVQKGRPIFNLAASFQITEPGLEHQMTMPNVPPPENLVSDQELALRIEDTIPEVLKTFALAERGIEMRPVEPYDSFEPEQMPPYRYVWCRAAGVLPDEDALHRYLLAYASDFHFLGTALHVHGTNWLMPNMQVASLDHAMWFHRPFRLDSWLLYVVESPSTAGARGLVHGQFFTREGLLVASTMQEGLIRRRDSH